MFKWRSDFAYVYLSIKIKIESISPFWGQNRSKIDRWLKSQNYHSTTNEMSARLFNNGYCLCYNNLFSHYNLLSLRFAWDVAEVKCILVTAVCVSVCVSLCLSLAAFPHCCTDPDVSWGNGRGCPLVVHCWADLQSVHEFHCCDNIALNAKCQRVLVLALYLVIALLLLRIKKCICFAALALLIRFLRRY